MGSKSEIEDEPSRYYAVLRLALVQDVRFLAGYHPSTILKLCLYASRYAEDLIEDIRAGTLKEGLRIDNDLRRMVEKRLAPDPGRADLLGGFLKQRNGRLMPMDCWPTLPSCRAMAMPA